MQEIIAKAVKTLKSGGIILHPTDTVCGLACDATNQQAVNKLKDIKKRLPGKSFIILVQDDRLLNKHIKEVPEVAWDIFDQATSPTTLILDDALFLADGVTAENKSVAVRKVNSGSVYEILKKFNRPLVSTSANISGEKQAVKVSEVDQTISSQVDLIIPEQSGVDNPTGKPSSIIKISNDGTFEIIRK